MPVARRWTAGAAGAAWSTWSAWWDWVAWVAWAPGLAVLLGCLGASSLAAKVPDRAIRADRVGQPRAQTRPARPRRVCPCPCPCLSAQGLAPAAPHWHGPNPSGVPEARALCNLVVEVERIDPEGASYR